MKGETPARCFEFKNYYYDDKCVDVEPKLCTVDINNAHCANKSCEVKSACGAGENLFQAFYCGKGDIFEYNATPTK